MSNDYDGPLLEINCKNCGKDLTMAPPQEGKTALITCINCEQIIGSMTGGDLDVIDLSYKSAYWVVACFNCDVINEVKKKPLFKIEKNQGKIKKNKKRNKDKLEIVK